MGTLYLIFVLVLCGIGWWATNYWAAELGAMVKFLRFVIIVIAVICTVVWLLTLFGLAAPFTRVFKGP